MGYMERNFRPRVLSSVNGRSGDEHDPRDPLGRLGRVMDAGSLTILATSESGVAVARGRIHGSRVIGYCTDGTKMGGALGAAGAQNIVRAIDLAVHERIPVVGLWHSGGARLADGVESMDGVGQMFAAMVRASGRVAQLSVVLGPAAGAAAYGPALTDIVIMAETGRMFVTGPDIVRSVTGEQVDMEGLGGTRVHGKFSGVVHIATRSEADALAHARCVIGLISRPGIFQPAAVRGEHDFRRLLPESVRRAYDVRPFVRELLDRPDGSAASSLTPLDGFEEFQAGWARNMVVGLGRLGGRSVGVIANNPLHKAGCLDSLSAEKAARFVRMCDAFGIPLIVIVDVPGYLPGVRQEWEGVIRRGAKLLYAFAESVVPRVTLITRKSYGGAYIAMNSRSLGATTVLAWPDAEIAVMGAESALNLLHRKTLAATPESQRPVVLARLAEEYHRDGTGQGIELGVIDEVIDPAQSRRRIAEALAAAPGGQGNHGNIPL